MPIFREGPGPYALALAMTGVRMGERQLLVGDDGPMFAALAAKTGLTGRAYVVAGTEESAMRIRAAAAEAGVLVEVDVAALPALPPEAQEFDVAVIDAGPTLLTRLDGPARAELVANVFRVLRTGGRAMVVEREPGGLLGVFRGKTQGLAEFRAHGGAAPLLDGAGFRPVRVLPEREGQRYTEGLKTTK
ncbi:MAG TPA: hypothetical protein VGK32_04520 [Vicinamibacterales bacterium]|jgi:SAM-dependent methyltransferase